MESQIPIFIKCIEIYNQKIRSCFGDDTQNHNFCFHFCCKKDFNKECVSHCGLAIYIKKHLKAKEELQKIQIFHHAII